MVPLKGGHAAPMPLPCRAPAPTALHLLLLRLLSLPLLSLLSDSRLFPVARLSPSPSPSPSLSLRVSSCGDGCGWDASYAFQKDVASWSTPLTSRRLRLWCSCKGGATSWCKRYAATLQGPRPLHTPHAHATCTRHMHTSHAHATCTRAPGLCSALVSTVASSTQWTNWTPPQSTSPLPPPPLPHRSSLFFSS